MTSRADPDLTQDLLDDLEQIVGRVNAEGQVVYLNRRGYDYIGGLLVESGGSHRSALRLDDYLHPDDRSSLLEHYQSAGERGEPRHFEARLRGKDGAYRWFSCHLTPRPDPHGSGLLYTLSCTDLEERKAAEQALRQSEARLKALVEAQKRFVADAAHELRAPLTAIQGNLEILQRFPRMKQADRQAALDEAAREAQRLARLVNDLLALARGDAGARFPLKPVGLRDLLREVFEEARHLADGHRLELGELPDLWAHGHRDRLKQVLIILLDNAFKYTPPGGTIRLELAEREGRAQIRVCDTGIGIASENLPHVFERFYRVDESRSQQSGGSGLGLSIAQWIVEQHGGKIWLESEVGQGTTAVVELSARLDPS